MSLLAPLWATSLLVACSTGQGTRGQSQAASPAPVDASGEPRAPAGAPVQFLLTAAADDFHAHRPPYPARFRDVRAGQLVTPDGAPQYMLCGQFLPAQGDATTG